jgi:hypothetical protein
MERIVDVVGWKQVEAIRVEREGERTDLGKP